MARVKPTKQKTNNGANVGYEAELWQIADALLGSMDAAEYTHVVFGLIFLKYISDAFDEQHAKLEGQRSQGAAPEDQDESRALNIFWVPPEACWLHLTAQAFILAPSMALEYFPAIAQSLYEWVDDLEIEFHTLAAVRDTLLPKLISGELRVKDAESFLEPQP